MLEGGDEVELVVIGKPERKGMEICDIHASVTDKCITIHALSTKMTIISSNITLRYKNNTVH